MAFKVSHLLFIILWLSLLLLLFHEFYNYKSKINTKSSINISHHSSSLSHRPLISRKVLASQFDFTPFQKHGAPHHGTDSPEGMQVQPAEPAKSEIDPRYGVDKTACPNWSEPIAPLSQKGALGASCEMKKKNILVSESFNFQLKQWAGRAANLWQTYFVETIAE
ncbi:hypothetical protein L1049_005947 [Liquidambar formosana]|uniref:Uncharacterized protein n=1 Tax=Liquidambar formosana TaxID=63359 RepID=A0AAP0WQQ9_LIQFO